MAFQVEPDDLSAYAKMINRAAEDTEEGKRYLAKFADIDASDQGLFTRPLGFHGSLVTHVSTVLGRLGVILDASSAELDKVAAYYRDTDQGEASRIDSRQPHVKR
ncbi:hypothetical protein ABT127_37140 [Streptomyces sp. NPDC001904]|uniref:hypothetical protein n=1 Tax=Streptomyces sp. NPDC001904 TaxID=3154531 RepID=UPI00331F72EA